MEPKVRKRKSVSGEEPQEPTSHVVFTEFHHTNPIATYSTSGQYNPVANHAPYSIPQILKRMFLPEGWPESCSEGIVSLSGQFRLPRCFQNRYHVCSTSCHACHRHTCTTLEGECQVTAGSDVILLKSCHIAPQLLVTMPVAGHYACADYLWFQAWDTFQALTSYIRGLLTSQAVLKGVGVGQQVCWYD